ncbi:MAG: glycosyltransferase family 9 protein [bacterium]
MDIQTMKTIDRFAGYPLCGTLRLYDLARQLFSGRRKGLDSLTAAPDNIELGDASTIMAIKFWGMGSLILAAPLFYELKKRWPNAQIILVTLEQNRDIVELLGIADRAYYLDLPFTPAGAFENILRLFCRVSRVKPGMAIDLEYLTRFSALVSYISGAPVRVGFHSWDVWRGNLQNVKKAFNPYWHVTENFVNLVNFSGNHQNSDIIPAAARVNAEGSEEEAGELLRSMGIDDSERIIAVNPNASTMAAERRWPENYFIELIDRIVEAGLGTPVLLGAPSETDYVSRVHERTKQPDRVFSIAGRSSLQGLVGVLKRASLLVTNDTGPLHLADALGTRTVSFFGPETPRLFGPRGKGHIVLYRNIDCSPCISIYNAKTVRCMKGEPECLSGISVNEAFEAVQKGLEENR